MASISSYSLSKRVQNRTWIFKKGDADECDLGHQYLPQDLIDPVSTLSGETVGSKAFAGTNKKPTVKVPAKQLKAYKKLLKARGVSSKAVYRK